MTLVDTNVLIDVIYRDATWFEWSLKTMATCAARGALVINEIIYAELSVRMETERQVNSKIEQFELRFERIPPSALFIAGQAFKKYRSAGGPRPTILPDFFVGAHAQFLEIPVLTRDPRRFRTYFPKVDLIMPE